MKRLLVMILCTMLLLACGCTTPSVQTAAPTPTQTETPAPTPTPVKTTPPDPTPTPIPAPTTVSILAVGDLMCLNGQLSAAKQDGEYKFDDCFSQVKEKISAADLAIGNLETLVAEDFAYTPYMPLKEVPCTITDTPDGVPMPTTTMTRGNTKINAPESYLSAVVDCGFDVLTTANNHIFDHKAKGIVQTMQKLDEYGVHHTGAYAAEQDKLPLIVDVNGINISVLAYTDILNNRPGRSEAYMVDTYEENQITSDIAATTEAGADFVIVSMHWGTEHTHRANRSQKNMAQFIAEAGADIILGSHSHCTQPFENIVTERGNVPVIYSLGNFISSMSKTMHNDGVIVHIVLEKEHENETTALKQLTYTPTLCTSTDIGRHIIYPADTASITGSEIATKLEKSRGRTVKVLGDTVATPK